MNMTTQTAWIISGLGFAILVGAFVLSSDSREYGRASMVDQHFIEQMIPHHEGAIAMAELALVKSKRPEVVTLAQGIIEAQEKEIADMRGWYEEWFGAFPEDGGEGMGMDHMLHSTGMVGDMDKLGAAPDFDLEFLAQMIEHHEAAVMMGQMLKAGTERTEMQVLADQIVASQQNEIELMRSWLKTWYDTTN